MHKITLSLLPILLLGCGSPDLTGTWTGTLDCDPEDSGWGDPTTFDMTLDLGKEPHKGTFSTVFSSSDPDGQLYYPGAKVQTQLDVEVTAEASNSSVVVSKTACTSYRIQVDDSEDPASCDDVSWQDDDTFDFDKKADTLTWTTGIWKCDGALTR